MELDMLKQRNDVILSKTALNSLCKIISDNTSDKKKIRGFLCPCGYVSTVEYEDKNVFAMVSKYCDL